MARMSARIIYSNYERISIVASRATLKTAREQKTANTNDRRSINKFSVRNKIF
ncbi:unnamed protein product [Trichogramma brassicae]|uniref:Uncharacterized protein n=1 Tax=Trichogramma brassicae TaxID=86971 RepID=A0A6H5ICK1_9HYME|nr:unnamed protein product [Trichogramma brassicae]